MSVSGGIRLAVLALLLTLADGRLMHPAMAQNPSDPGRPDPGQPDPGRPDPGVPIQPAAAPAPAAAPLLLQQPRVETTATLSSGTDRVSLFGVIGVGGAVAQALQEYIQFAGNTLLCVAEAAGDHRCTLPNGEDIAMVALRNGALRVRADASDPYRAQETAAQNERRGIWANLPPPPVQIHRPGVMNTATLQAEGTLYHLDGIIGLSGLQARELQDYIRANGDALMCQPRSGPDIYLCLMANGADIAQVALVNGAAKVTDDAPPSYRRQQNDAIAHRRGIWALPQPDAQPLLVDELPEAGVTYTVGADEEALGIVYISDAPAILIDDEPVFMIWGGVDLGWGYWRPDHTWIGLSVRHTGYMDRHFRGGGAYRGHRPFQAARISAGRDGGAGGALRGGHGGAGRAGITAGGGGNHGGGGGGNHGGGHGGGGGGNHGVGHGGGGGRNAAAGAGGGGGAAHGQRPGGGHARSNNAIHAPHQGGGRRQNFYAAGAGRAGGSPGGSFGGHGGGGHGGGGGGHRRR